MNLADILGKGLDESTPCERCGKPATKVLVDGWTQSETQQTPLCDDCYRQAKEAKP